MVVRRRERAGPNELVELSHEAFMDEDVQGHRFLLEVPFDMPVLTDHFPGSPIVPAFIQIAEVIRRTQRLWPELGPWGGASAMKFKAPIEPGFTLELELRRPAGSSRVWFTIDTAMGSSSGTRCASGTLRFGSSGDEHGEPAA